ncbi:unnamed protein product [Medioppia subpectinata]|uniref:Decapping nuclease n=1 Tax=Medioppia subpectinata TaxID=1979941 RepID=A0A7R9Q623_9ACAR|nr:unnamed protein product [Medioppia subpectinata]CAG2113446.1 unnamed protein product [Medioppia subpectinata]
MSAPESTYEEWELKRVAQPSTAVTDLINSTVELTTRNLRSVSVVDRLSIRSRGLIDNKWDESKQRVLHFSIDCDQKYDTTKELPKLKASEEWPQLSTTDLETGFADCVEDNGLITDYEAYRELKWQSFHRALKDNDLIDKYKPQFVSFGGPVAEIMATVFDTSNNWKVSAQLTSGVIYFYKTRSERQQNPYSVGNASRRTYCGLNFLHLITDREDIKMNEFHKFFGINCVTLDSHKLLTLNEIDAIDDNERPVDLKLVEESRSLRDDSYFEKKKSLRFWSKAWLQGMDEVVMATISHNVLMDIDSKKVPELAEMGSRYWSSDQCIHFLIRFLSFMKTCITDENMIYDFSFRRGDDSVECIKQPLNDSNAILPNSCTQESNVKDLETILDASLKISD